MIFQTTTNSFRQECFQAVHNFGPTSPDTFKIALYISTATLNADTTVYTSSSEVVGTGYTAGGLVLTINQSPTVQTNAAGNGIAFVGFANAVWSSASFTARGALIYNASKGNKAVAVLDFGADKTVSNATFTVTMPQATASTAIIRIG